MPNVTDEGVWQLASATPPLDQEPAQLGHLTDLVGYHLRRAVSVVGNDFSRALAGTGIRQVLFGILSIVGANPGINQGAVGRALGIQRANMVSLINELVDRELIDRATAEDDRRAFSLTLTKAGEGMTRQCLSRIRAHEDGLLSELTAKERKILLTLLSKIEAKET